MSSRIDSQPSSHESSQFPEQDITSVVDATDAAEADPPPAPSYPQRKGEVNNPDPLRPSSALEVSKVEDAQVLLASQAHPPVKGDMLKISPLSEEEPVNLKLNDQKDRKSSHEPSEAISTFNVSKSTVPEEVPSLGASDFSHGHVRGSRTRSVPSSPLARVFGFGQLAAGLAMGTVVEAMRQSYRGGGESGEKDTQNGGAGGVKQYVVSDGNAERLAEALCRMRGAALKLGQMLSIQDESVIPPSLAKALERVRQGADVMPQRQVYKQLERSLGENWRSRLESFDETPIAAASIGQVFVVRCFAVVLLLLSFHLSQSLD
ncbi:unnamed protein product [Choristocarpus tenellus]